MSDSQKRDARNTSIPPEDPDVRENDPDAGQPDAPEGQPPEKLNLQVAIDQRSTCERHITVTVAREDIERYYDKEFSDLMSTAQVPGFRPGHAPRKLVEHRFRKDVAERVKSALLADSIAQVNEDEDLSAISEPALDLEAVELPDEGPMTFEFDIEVRPEFELPQWKGLEIEKPVRRLGAADVDRSLQDLLSRRGRLVPHDGPAAPGDYISTNLTFKDGDQEISTASEEVIRIRPVLSFRDGRIEKFDELMSGVCAGETRIGQAQIAPEAPNESLRGKKITAIFEILEVKKLQLPELTPLLLEEMGGFQSEAELRDAIKDTLERRLEYHQHQHAREQITAALTVAADWELPPELLRRQSRRELQRVELELQRSGFTEEEIRARENELRQDSLAATARALKEHFILERIAEAEEMEPTEEDYDAEISLIGQQSSESPRRVRARLEKGGLMDVLRNQIVERKVVEKILSCAQFKEVPYQPQGIEAEALDRAVAGGEQESEIPQAKPEVAHAKHAEGPKPSAEAGESA